MEEDFDTHGHHYPDKRCRHQPQRKLNVSPCGTGEIPDANNIANDNSEANCHYVVCEAAKHKEGEKEAATDPEKMDLRSGSKQLCADRDEERAKQERTNHEDRRAGRGDQSFA